MYVYNTDSVVVKAAAGPLPICASYDLNIHFQSSSSSYAPGPGPSKPAFGNLSSFPKTKPPSYQVLASTSMAPGPGALSFVYSAHSSARAALLMRTFAGLLF